MYISDKRITTQVILMLKFTEPDGVMPASRVQQNHVTSCCVMTD